MACSVRDLRGSRRFNEREVRTLCPQSRCQPSPFAYTPVHVATQRKEASEIERSASTDSQQDATNLMSTRGDLPIRPGLYSSNKVPFQA